MTNFLIVPIRIDALILEQDTALCGPKADFSRLPYWTSQGSGGTDHNPDVPFLSSSILEPPVMAQGYIAGKGVHLHWALPDTLTQSRSGEGGSIEMPVAPNRWLVSRIQNDQVQQWVVESDYLFAADDTSATDAVSYPAFDMATHASHSDALTASGFVPWRRMGRVQALDGWTEPLPAGAAGDARKSFLHGLTGQKLTTLGWGDPSFAAFYPNCRGVFGFHDGGSPPASEVTCEVIGWHADPSDDILAWDAAASTGSKFLSDAIQATRAKYSAEDAASGSETIWKKAIEERFGWQCTDAGMASRSLLLGRLRIPADWKSATRPEVSVELALGCNGMEALSTWLAQTSKRPAGSTWDQGVVEDRLEAVQIDGFLSSQAIDTGFKFREAQTSA